MSRRFRDWYRPWNWSTKRWVLTLIVCMTASPFITRWLCLWQVPDVPLTFDVEEFLVRENVADEDDANIDYREAMKLTKVNRSRLDFRGTNRRSIRDAILEALSNPDAPWDPRIEPWLDEHQPALAKYRRGGEKPFAKGASLRTADDDLVFDVHSELRILSWHAQLQAVRCENAGDLEAAWRWHLANLQAGRHAETPCLNIGRAIGGTIRSTACSGIARWSRSPSLSAAEIREARGILRSEAARRTPQTDLLKGGYLFARNNLRRPDIANQMLPNLSKGVFGHHSLFPFKQIRLWMFGQPELTLRLWRQLLVNNRQEIDRPFHVRKQTLNCRSALVFEHDPSAERPRGQLPPKALAKILDQSIVPLEASGMWLIVRHLNIDLAIRMDDARLATVSVALAAQQFHREQGEFPAAFEQLIPDYLSAIPYDPMSAQGLRLRYRRESSHVAVVWSIGRDGVDDDGDVKATDPAGLLEGKDVGYHIQFGRSSKRDNEPALESQRDEAVEQPK